MKQKIVYLANSAISLLFALGLLLMTPVMLRLFDMDATNDARTLAQLIAVELAVGGLITLLARDVTDPKARSAIHYSNMLAGVLGMVVALNATLTGVFGWFGWVIFVVYLAVAGMFAYLHFFAWGE